MELKKVHHVDRIFQVIITDAVADVAGNSIAKGWHLTVSVLWSGCVGVCASVSLALSANTTRKLRTKWWQVMIKKIADVDAVSWITMPEHSGAE